MQTFKIFRMHSQWFLQQFQSNYIDWRTVDEDMYLFHYVRVVHSEEYS